MEICEAAIMWKRSWFRHCVSSRKVAGSIPYEVIGFFGLSNPVILRVPGMFLWVKGSWKVKLTLSPPSLSQLSRQCGILNISQPYGTLWSVIGTALFLFLLYLLGNKIGLLGSRK
jgi:hypothetical protein